VTPTDRPAAPGAAPDVLELAARRLRVLGHPLRLRLIELLAGGEHTISALAEITGETQHMISKHLSELHHADIAARTKDGNHAVYSLPDSHTVRAVALICRGVRDERVRQARRILEGG
jgi:DNA-binding transcriptional ArsR family regulator